MDDTLYLDGCIPPFDEKFGENPCEQLDWVLCLFMTRGYRLCLGTTESVIPPQDHLHAVANESILHDQHPQGRHLSEDRVLFRKDIAAFQRKEGLEVVYASMQGQYANNLAICMLGGYLEFPVRTFLELWV